MSSIFDAITNAKVSLHKTNGEIIDNIKATVSKKIHIMRSDILIEPEDLIVRKMSNGAQETYKVINPGFHEAFHNIPAHYQIEVRLLGIPEARKEEQTIINNYHLSGINSRINQNSTDYSTNIISINSELQKHLEGLRNAINDLKISSQEKNDANEIINTIEDNFKKEKPNKTLIESLLKGLPVASNIITIGNAILASLQ